MMHAVQKTDRRFQEREIVDWAVLWEGAPGLYVIGHIYDMTSGGLFLRPPPEYLSCLEEGDSLQVMASSSKINLNFNCKVRWVGKSNFHQCAGFGLQIEGTRPALKAMLQLGQDKVA